MQKQQSTIFFFYLSLMVILGTPSLCFSKTIMTNAAVAMDAPEWLKSIHMRKASNSIENKMEWTVRRVDVYFHATQESFDKVQSFGSRPTAVTVSTKTKSVIHLGPKVNKGNFGKIYSHELVHVVIRQKYRGAIPKWLEEGFANHFAKRGKVDYKWLAKQPLPKDITELSHPLKGDEARISYRYKASQALVEMLDKKCDLDNLVRLSVQRKMVDYIHRSCELKDLNAEYKKWILKKSGALKLSQKDKKVGL